MNTFPSIDLLTEEYNEGLLDKDGLRPYIGLGCITEEQFNNLTSKAPSNPIFNFNN